jgi:hypothetical protein
MKMIPVQSSNVESIGYEPAAQRLDVKFRGGKTYRHDNVSEQDYRRFMAADSKGRHYHENFKGRHVR